MHIHSPQGRLQSFEDCLQGAAGDCCSFLLSRHVIPPQAGTCKGWQVLPETGTVCPQQPLSFFIQAITFSTGIFSRKYTLEKRSTKAGMKRTRRIGVKLRKNGLTPNPSPNGEGGRFISALIFLLAERE